MDWIAEEILKSAVHKIYIMKGRYQKKKRANCSNSPRASRAVEDDPSVLAMWHFSLTGSSVLRHKYQLDNLIGAKNTLAAVEPSCRKQTQMFTSVLLISPSALIERCIRRISEFLMVESPDYNGCGRVSLWKRFRVIHFPHRRSCSLWACTGLWNKAPSTPLWASRLAPCLLIIVRNRKCRFIRKGDCCPRLLGPTVMLQMLQRDTAQHSPSSESTQGHVRRRSPI